MSLHDADIIPWYTVPSLRTDADFTRLAIELNSSEQKLLASVNGMITLGELRDGLHIDAHEIQLAAKRLRDLGLIQWTVLPSSASPFERRTRGRPSVEPPRVEPAPAKPRAPESPAALGEPWEPQDVGRIVGQIVRDKKEGLLRLIGSDGRYKTLFFLPGRLIQVTSHPFDPAECLGRILQKTGRIEESSVLSSLQIRKNSGHLQGEALVELGIMSAQELRMVLERQIEYKLADLMLWEGGSWLFTEVEGLAERIRPVEVRLPKTLFGIYWKRFDISGVEQLFEAHRRLWVGLPDNPAFPVHQLKISPHVDRVWMPIRTADVEYEKLMVALRLATLPTFRVVWTLKLCGFIEFFDAPRDRSGKAS